MRSIVKKKKFDKRTAYSRRTNAFIEFYHFMKKRISTAED